MAEIVILPALVLVGDERNPEEARGGFGKPDEAIGENIP